MSMLASYHDPTLTVAEDATFVTLREAELERLLLQANIVFAMLAMPRRMGSEASDEDLAADKKKARRVHHALSECYFDWTGRKKRPRMNTTDEVRQEATQISWERWWPDHQRYLDQRRVYIATWALGRSDKDQRWAKGAIVKLLNEQRWVEYALR